jgi:hypothetical protein
VCPDCGGNYIEEVTAITMGTVTNRIDVIIDNGTYAYSGPPDIEAEQLELIGFKCETCGKLIAEDAEELVEFLKGQVKSIWDS